MESSRITARPDEVTTIGTGLSSRVVLFNDSVHSYSDVVQQLMKAVHCSEKQGFYFAYEVDHRGSATVYSGEFERCLEVSQILSEIGLISRIEC